VPVPSSPFHVLANATFDARDAPAPRALKRLLRMIFFWTAGILLVLAFSVWAYFTFAASVGSDPSGERLARIQASPNYHDGRFANVVPTNMDMPAGVMLKVVWEMLKGGQGREPIDTIPTVRFDRQAWDQLPDTGYALAWFGHSSLLLRMDGVTFLIDPVFGERASTFSFIGPKRFPYTSQMDVAQLPKIDVVLISHDHYDHLDQVTIAALVASGRTPRYLTALGVGAHLEAWGVPADAITEKDWWEALEVGPLTLRLVPSRHFSGRKLTNRFSTLWGAWVIEGKERKVFFGADSGYSPTFKEVGERFGPFDLALLECGAYNVNWADIHMAPEEVAQAALDLRARVLMPVHWGKFNLALHPWKEPIERLEPRCRELGVPLFTVRPGRIVQAAVPEEAERWWTDLR
jgi:L-ascorbate metabolism protein UlaG (beta-lactamase superfamily)